MKLKLKKSKPIEVNSLELKVYKNKKTGQATVMLPKKKFKVIPKKIKVRW